MLDVARVPVLSDNYVWLVHDPQSDETVAIDPGDARPVLDAAAARGWQIAQIWNTHWHADHTGGNAAVRAATGAPITGPVAEAARIDGLDATVSDGDMLRLGGHCARVIATPGHTAGHVSIHFPDDRIVFTGDTLFAMGCGRLFEGTAADMFASLARFAEMDDDTVIYCGHEYTQANGRYALTAEPDNAAIHSRMNDVDRLRALGEPTVPTTMALERATNPFLRARSAEQLAQRRAAKDSFRG
ncbi:hydroxyacylglutathione hydrolase [Sphingomonas bacterium]|uniref:hydroxyacylglutathione hydrolase n=1 Tax=Sphingomonas bacterium TaxID=1895847 RepID=UPI0015750461|nr:hydroxyacylglutathione hydrolase [Sphingomonas bacterium]